MLLLVRNETSGETGSNWGNNMRKSILDEEILNIEGNQWTVRDACTGTMVFGMTGSGKSSGPLHKIAGKFLGEVPKVDLQKL